MHNNNNIIISIIIKLLGIYAKYLINIYRRCMPYMKLLTSNFQYRTLYTYLTFITEQTWLPHSKHSSYDKYGKWAYQTNIFAYIYQNTTDCNSYFMLLQNICKKKYVHQMGHVCHMCLILDVHIWVIFVHICATCEASTLKTILYKVVHTGTWT